MAENDGESPGATVLEFLRLFTLLEGVQGAGNCEGEEIGEITIYTKDVHGTTTQLDLNLTDQSFTYEVWWLGRCRKRRQEQEQAERLKTHCIECGCLKEKGHLPDCHLSYYPIALTLNGQEPGIVKKWSEPAGVIDADILERLRRRSEADRGDDVR